MTNWREAKYVSREQIENRLQELDYLHEFTPAQQKEFDRLEERLAELNGDNL